MTSPCIFGYAIDSAGVLDTVDESWLEFARLNGAPELTRASVLGRPIEEFIAGTETRRLYALLFDRVRGEGVSLSVPFRCDSPRCLRFMELQLHPARHSRVRLRSRLLREEPRPHRPILDQLLSGTVYDFPICSICKRIMVFGEWMQPEDAIERLDMFGTSNAPALDYGICGECAASAAIEQRA